MLSKDLPQSVLGSLEADVRNEENLARFADIIAKLAGTIRRVGCFGCCLVNSDRASIDFFPIKGLDGLLSSFSRGEYDITEPSRTAGVSVHLD
jgi:hypothetical protein